MPDLERLSRKSRTLLHAVQAGYTLSADGQAIIQPDGAPVTLRPDGPLKYPAFFIKGCAVPAHRFVALVKFGAEALFAPGIEVRHLDGTKTNFRPDNIVLGTRAENVADRRRPDYAGARLPDGETILGKAEYTRRWRAALCTEKRAERRRQDHEYKAAQQQMRAQSPEKRATYNARQNERLKARMADPKYRAAYNAVKRARYAGQKDARIENFLEGDHGS